MWGGVDQKMCSVQMEDGNQSCVPLYSGTIWQKSLKIYATVLHTAAASQCSQRRALLETYITENLYFFKAEVSTRIQGCKTQPSWCGVMLQVLAKPKGLKAMCSLAFKEKGTGDFQCYQNWLANNFSHEVEQYCHASKLAFKSFARPW